MAVKNARLTRTIRAPATATDGDQHPIHNEILLSLPAKESAAILPRLEG